MGQGINLFVMLLAAGNWLSLQGKLAIGCWQLADC
jgi:hypothetical protein